MWASLPTNWLCPPLSLPLSRPKQKRYGQTETSAVCRQVSAVVACFSFSDKTSRIFNDWIAEFCLSAQIFDRRLIWWRLMQLVYGHKHWQILNQIWRINKSLFSHPARKSQFSSNALNVKLLGKLSGICSRTIVTALCLCKPDPCECLKTDLKQKKLSKRCEIRHPWVFSSVSTTRKRKSRTSSTTTELNDSQSYSKNNQ